MEQSILKTTKKLLGLDVEYKEFDIDIIMHVNDALSALTQIGVGPTEGFMIEDDTATWDAFLGTDPRLNMAKVYVAQKTKVVWDPPQSPHAMNAILEQIKEKEVRLQMAADPAPEVIPA